jgi:hypothetical protein
MGGAIVIASRKMISELCLLCLPVNMLIAHPSMREIRRSTLDPLGDLDQLFS